MEKVGTLYLCSAYNFRFYQYHGSFNYDGLYLYIEAGKNNGGLYKYDGIAEKPPNLTHHN